MHKFLISILALFSLATAGCAGSESNASQPIASINKEGSLSGNWKIVRLGSEAIEQNQRTANMNFENGRVSGTAFCNNYGGEIKGQMPNISFGPMMSTEMACMENMLMDKEAKFHAMLGEVKSASQNCNELQFKNQSGEVIAVFRK